MATRSPAKTMYSGAPALEAARQAFRSAFAAGYDRLFLWIPVVFGVGIGTYFGLAEESDRFVGPLATALCAIAAIALRRAGKAGFVLPAALAIAAAGFSVAQFRTAAVDAPRLEREIGPLTFSGRVLAVETQARGVRLLLDRLEGARLARAGRVPERVRISLRTGGEGVSPGDRLTVLAVLQPPPAPSFPGGYDFARAAWFSRIGAVGYALGAPRAVDPGSEGSLVTWIAGVRRDATARILAAASEASAPVAAALMTGERRAIPEETLSNMRDAGLAHLLAISGLHIGLVAGLLFFAVRFGLAAIEPFTLRYPIKKIAAAAAVVGAFFYLLVSGSTIPTERAFLMASIAFGAIMIDRTPISLRLVAVAAVVVLALSPESLLTASFQMSFAAVVALVAGYEAAAPRFAEWRSSGWLASRFGLFLAATLLTTVIATAATSPFAIYHFNRLALYGLAANLFAVPITAFWIMPWAVAAFVLMPVGLEALALTPMGWGIEAVLWVAETVSGWPGAVALISPMPLAALCAAALGGLWICLWRGRVRWFGLPVFLAGLAGPAISTPPDILVGDDGRLVAVRDRSGAVYLSPGRGQRFEREMWLRYLGASESAGWPAPGAGPAGPLSCDGAGCIVRLDGRSLSLASGLEAVTADCARTDAMIVLVRAPRRLCGPEKVLFSTFHLWRDGGHAIRVDRAGFEIESVRERRGDRPWSRLSERKRQYLRTSPTSRP